MKKLQKSARYLCYRINDAFGEIIPRWKIVIEHEQHMCADHIIPVEYRGRALDIAFDEIHGEDVFFTKGLSEAFIDTYIKEASEQTIKKYRRYKDIVLKRYGSKKAYESATEQHGIAEIALIRYERTE